MTNFRIAKEALLRIARDKAEDYHWIMWDLRAHYAPSECYTDAFRGFHERYDRRVAWVLQRCGLTRAEMFGYLDDHVSRFVQRKARKYPRADWMAIALDCDSSWVISLLDLAPSPWEVEDA